MAEKIIMPQGGQDLKFGTVVRWFKKEGETVKKNELVCEVETEKAVFEVNAPSDGVVLKIIKQDGEEAEVLSAIGYIGEAGEEIVLKGKPTAEETVKSASPAAPEKTRTTAAGQVKISPKARKIAMAHNLDISALQSSRPDGKITSEDVEKAIAAASGAGAEADVTGGHIVFLGKVQAIGAKRLVQSWNQAPHFFVTVSVDMTDVMAARKVFNASNPEAKVSVNDLVIKAAALALQDFPRVNSSYRDERSLIEWEEINIGIATASEDGLLVPVLENAEKLSVQEISQQVKAITRAAREGRQISESPSHFTISNLGMYQVDRFSAIINPPESAILAVASVQKKAVVDEKEEVVVRDMMELTLSLDHRVGDGVLAAEFLNRIKTYLESSDSKL